MTIEVRKASDADLDWMFSELQAFDDFFGAKKSLIPSDPAEGRKILENLVEQHLFLVAERDGKLLGLIAGMIHNHLFNPEVTVLTEIFWWVPSEYRGSRAGLMLLNEFTNWGKENVDWVTMTLEHHSPVNEKSLFKRGFKLSEKQYMLEVH